MHHSTSTVLSRESLAFLSHSCTPVSGFDLKQIEKGHVELSGVFLDS